MTDARALDPKVAEDPLPRIATRVGRRPEEHDEREQPELGKPKETLDPLLCALSHPRVIEPPATAAAAQPARELPVEALLERLVRRMAVGGSGKRGTARIELGAGGLDGTTVTIHADDAGEVSVELELAPGARGDWHEGLKEKLERRGLRVKSIEVR
jgi:hypothetical protein